MTINDVYNPNSPPSSDFDKFVADFLAADDDDLNKPSSASCVDAMNPLNIFDSEDWKSSSPSTSNPSVDSSDPILSASASSTSATSVPVEAQCSDQSNVLRSSHILDFGVSVAFLEREIQKRMELGDVDGAEEIKELLEDKKEYKRRKRDGSFCQMSKKLKLKDLDKIVYSDMPCRIKREAKINKAVVQWQQTKTADRTWVRSKSKDLSEFISACQQDRGIEASSEDKIKADQARNQIRKLLKDFSKYRDTYLKYKSEKSMLVDNYEIKQGRLAKRRCKCLTKVFKNNGLDINNISAIELNFGVRIEKDEHESPLNRKRSREQSESEQGVFGYIASSSSSSSSHSSVSSADPIPSANLNFNVTAARLTRAIMQQYDSNASAPSAISTSLEQPYSYHIPSVLEPGKSLRFYTTFARLEQEKQHLVLLGDLGGVEKVEKFIQDKKQYLYLMEERRKLKRARKQSEPE